jgi:hypothetical protein
MSAPTAAAPLQRRFWRPRFSLRALLIVMTLLCLVFAPMLPELNRSDRIARQVKIIEEMGGLCVFVDRPHSFFAGLMQRWWPVKIAHIEHDLLMAEFGERTVDLAKLRQTPDIRGVCFNECLFVVPENEPDIRLPRIEYVQLQERDDMKGGKPDPAIMRRFPAFFPNLRKAQLMGVPQRQTFIDSLADRLSLQDLDLWFRYGDDESVDTTALGGLSQLHRLRLSGETGPWNWAFLARLEKLEEVELGNEQQPAGGRYSEPPFQGTILEPSHALTQLRSLRSLKLYEDGDWSEQLEEIAQNNDLESMHIPRGWPAMRALAGLQSETNIRKLSGVWIGEDEDRVSTALQHLQQLSDLEIGFAELTDREIRLLAELPSLERITLSFDGQRGGVTEDGLMLFHKLPVVELQGKVSYGRSMTDSLKRLVDSWPGPGSGMSFRQTDDGKQFLLRDAQK